jgi:hypothetical protein
MLFGLFAIYALSGPLLWLWRRIRKSRRGPAGAGTGDSSH